jgi:putative sigma-54 modulation protein
MEVQRLSISSGMKINIKAKNIEITQAISDYVEKKVTNLEKILSQIEENGGEVLVNFEVGKSTNHHKSGDVFHSDCLINIDGREFYSSSDKEDLYQTIDEIKENLFRDISKNKNKKKKLFYNGARKIKEMIKGIRNWKK